MKEIIFKQLPSHLPSLRQNQQKPKRFLAGTKIKKKKTNNNDIANYLCKIAAIPKKSYFHF